MRPNRSSVCFVTLAALLTVSAACSVSVQSGGDTVRARETAATTGPLPSWVDGAAKAAIVDFVERVTDPGSADFVPPAERVATFDNDGTLWAEKPLYFEFPFVYERIRAQAAQNPSWSTREPFKTVIESTAAFPDGITETDFVPLLVAGETGQSNVEFAAEARAFLATARHPRFDRLYTDLVYQPMLELLDYLRAREFDVHIVSGGTVEFIRAYA